MAADGTQSARTRGDARAQDTSRCAVWPSEARPTRTEHMGGWGGQERRRFGGNKHVRSNGRHCAIRVHGQSTTWSNFHPHNRRAPFISTLYGASGLLWSNQLWSNRPSELGKRALGKLLVCAAADRTHPRQRDGPHPAAAHRLSPQTLLTHSRPGRRVRRVTLALGGRPRTGGGKPALVKL